MAILGDEIGRRKLTDQWSSPDFGKDDEDDPFKYPVVEEPDPREAEINAQLAVANAADATDTQPESPAANSANAAADADWKKWKVVTPAPEAKTYPTIASDQPGALDLTPPVPPGHIDLRPPVIPPKDLKTDEDTGIRYVEDKETGQKIPYAELATEADKQVFKPSDATLSQVDVEATGEPQDKLTQVERGELVGLPYHPAVKQPPAPDTLAQVEKAQPPPDGYIADKAIPIPAGPVTPAKPEPIPSGPLTPTKPVPIPAEVNYPDRVQAVGDVDPAAFIVHHTSGRGTVDGVISTLKERGLGVEYVMDREGNIHQTGNAGASQIKTGWGKGEGLNNSNTVGMEIIAKDDKDVTPAQAQSFAKFIAARYPNTPLYGHGEVNPGHKEEDEGLTAKAAALAYRQGTDWQNWPEAAAGAAKTPRAESIQPPGVVAQTKGGFTQDEDPKKWVQGRATTFGYNDPEDNGVGSPYVGGLSTNNTELHGIAIPEGVLQQRYGNNYAAWRKARVDVVDTTTGRRLRVPIVDLGPGDEQLQKGISADFTEGTNRYFGNTGEGNYAFNLVDNAGPDVKSHPSQFWDEQAAIRSGIDTGSKDRKPTDPANHFMTWPALDEGTVAAAQSQKQGKEQETLNTLADQNPNPSGLYKRLNEKVEGVSDQTRQQYQAKLKEKITAEAMDYYGEKDPQKAFQTATSDADFGTVVGEIGSKIIPYWQKAALALGQTADTGDTNRIDQFIKMIHPEADPKARAEFKRDLLAKPVNERNQYVGALIKHLEDEKNKEAEGSGSDFVSTIDHPTLLDAIDRAADPKAQAERQVRIDAAVAENLKNLRQDPRLINTPAGFITQQLAQLPKNVSEALIPVIGQNMMLSEIYTDTYGQLKAEHPKASDAEIKEMASKSTLAQLLPQEVMMMLTGGMAGGITKGISNTGTRIMASMGTHAAIGAPVGAIQKGVQNIVEGKPVTEGLGEAAAAGAIQAAPGGIIGGLHGGRPREEAAPTPVEPSIPIPEAKRVTAAGVLGPDVPDTSMPWYKPGPLVTRATERTAFSPQELATRTEELRQQGWTPKQIQQVVENLQPEPDFNRRTVHLSEEALAMTPPAAAREETLPFESARAVGESDPWVSRIANRLTAERIVKNEIGAVEPGHGVTKEEMLARGLKMGPEEINQHVSNVMNNVGGNPRDQASAIRTEEARLSQRSHAASLFSEANPANRQARIVADNAFKDLTDFHNGPVAKLKNDWHAQGMTLQGEIPVDLSTFNGLREQFLKDTGKSPPAEMETVLRQTAKQVRDASVSEAAALKSLGAEIERQSANRPLPTHEQVRENIMKRMGVEPCPN